MMFVQICFRFSDLYEAGIEYLWCLIGLCRWKDVIDYTTHVFLEDKEGQLYIEGLMIKGKSTLKC